MPMKRIVLGVALTLLVGLASIGGYMLVTDGAMAQDSNSNFWGTAGGPEGFLDAEWGTGKGPGVSLDDAIQSFPETCDIQIIDREGAKNVMFRCPD